MLRKVLKRIPKGRGEYLESGLVIEVSGWRNVKVLEASRYLGPVTDDEANAYAAAQKPVAPKAKPSQSKKVSELKETNDVDL